MLNQRQHVQPSSHDPDNIEKFTAEEAVVGIDVGNHRAAHVRISSNTSRRSRLPLAVWASKGGFIKWLVAIVIRVADPISK